MELLSLGLQLLGVGAAGGGWDEITSCKYIEMRLWGKIDKLLRTKAL